MRNACPLECDLLVAGNVLTKVLLNELVVSLVHTVGGEVLALFDACVHLLFKGSEHSLTIKGALVGLHKSVKDIELFLIRLALGKLAVSEKKLVYGRCNLGNEDAIAAVVGLVVLSGEPGVHRVARLVSEGGNVIVIAVVVKKNVGLAIRTACAECAAALALGGVNVYPALFGKTLFKGVVVLVAVNLNGLENVVYRFLIAVLTGERANEGSVDVVKVELVKAEDLALKLVVIVKGLEAALNGLYKVVVYLGGNLILVGGCGERVLVMASLCKGRFLSDAAVKQGRKGVGELTVGAVHLLECAHTDTAVGGADVDTVACIGKLNALAVLGLDLAELHIRVCKDASDIFVRVKAVAKRGPKLFTLVRECVLLLAHDLLNHTAEGFKLGELGKPLFNRLVIESEDIGVYEPAGAVCAYCQASYSTRESLEGVVGGVGRKVEVCVAPKLFDKAADNGHIGERVIEILCGGGNGLFVLFEVGDHRLSALKLGVERINAFVDRGEIPFILCFDIFSFKCHFLFSFFVVMVEEAMVLVGMGLVRTAELDGILRSRALLFLGLDVAGLGEGDLGEHRTKELVNKNCEEGDVSNDGSDIGKVAGEDGLSLHRHTERNARLGKKGDAEVFYDSVLTLHHLGA